jgi:gluconolactonase
MRIQILPSLMSPFRFHATLALAVSLAACTSSAPARTGQAGTTGASGGAGVTGAAGAPTGSSGATGTAGSPGTAGATGAAGAAGSSAGASGGMGTAGSTGVAGATGGAGSPPDGGTTGAGGSVADGGTAFKKFQCPPGPYPAQMQGTSTTICNSGAFKYNYPFNEGPTWLASQNAFFFSNFIQGNTGTNKSAGDIIKVSLAPDGSATCEVWLHDVGCNGLHVSFATGKILGACHGPRAVMEYDPVTKAGRVVANMVDGQMLDSPNDIISTSNGNIYFSNPTFELGGRPPGIGNAVVRIDPTGVTSVLQKSNCNGVTLSPDEKTLYVVGAGVWMLNDDGSPGMKTNQPAPGGDGLSMDCAGHVLSIGTMGAFGGPDGKTVLTVSGGTAKLVQMTVPGFP